MKKYNRGILGLLLVSGLLAIACGGATPPQETQPTMPTTPDVTAPPSEPIAPPAEPTAAPPPEHAAAPVHAAPHWTYAGETGPDKWGELSPEWAACKTGKAQSPIDLPAKGAKDKTQKPPVLAYEKMPVKIINNGHTVQLNNSVKGQLTLGTQSFDLAQAHMHAPSEHTVAGKHLDAEMHFVHKTAAGQIAVIGVFFKQGKKENKALAAYFANLPAAASEADVAVEKTFIDVPALLGKGGKLYRYDGSLTTPPCTEGVTWFVAPKVIEISPAQLTSFRTVMQNVDTNRPVQPLGERQVLQF